MTRKRDRSQPAAGPQIDLTDPVAAANNLAATFQALTDQLARLRRLAIRTALSVGLDVVLTIGVTIIGGLVIHADASATTATRITREIHASQLNACRVGNQLRAEQRQLWEHLAAISTPPPHETRAQAKARAVAIRELLAYVRKVFPTLNCRKLYRLHSGGSHGAR